MADTDGTVMRRAGHAPAAYELLGRDAEAIAAVDVSDVEHRSIYRFAFCNKKRNALLAFNHRKKCDRTVA